MRHPRTIDRAGRMRSAWPLLRCRALLVLAGCHSKDNASGMTSFSSKASPSATPQLFTIPADQMSHVQVVTVEPGAMAHTLRLTGTVAYNAFNTTPVITQVGGPVSRILVVPGDHVKTESAHAGGEQPGLRAVAGRLPEGRGFVPAGRQVIHARAGPVCAPCNCTTGSGDGGEQSHAGAGGPERRRAGHADSGHQESGGTGKDAVVGADPGAGADCRRGGGAAGFARAGGAGRADAGLHHLRPEHGVGAGQRVPGRSRIREERRRRGGADRCVSRQLPRQDFVCVAGARSQYSNAAGARRSGQPRARS